MLLNKRVAQVVVLCGRLVANAFGLSLARRVPWTEEKHGVRFLVLPHPSGVSHFWNEEESWHRAAMVFRSALRFVGLVKESKEGHEKEESTGSWCSDPVEPATVRAEPAIRSKFFTEGQTEVKVQP